MEAQWVAKRSALRCLALQHLEWTRPQLAQACGASVSCVKKWLKRFRETDPNDLKVLFSRSRARHTLPPPPDLRLVQRVIEIRTSPPENAARAPRGLVPFSTISSAIPSWLHKALPRHARRAPSGNCCASSASSSIRSSAHASQWSRVRLYKRCRPISKRSPRFLLILRASSSM
jgi:Homeodomain-like domain-containing protein